jgi:hypothetical protein
MINLKFSKIKLTFGISGSRLHKISLYRSFILSKKLRPLTEVLTLIFKRNLESE